MKILIGYDGSPSAQDALLDLTRAGLPAKAKVRILTALNPWIPADFLSTSEPGINAWYSAAYAEAVAEAEATTHRAKGIAIGGMDFLKPFFPGWTMAVDPCLGPPDHALLDKADEWKPDLICLGTHDRSGMAGLLGGSVSQKVLHHAHCSVRIARPGFFSPRTPIRIILAMDGSTLAEAALQEVLRREWPKGSEICLMMVMDLRLKLGNTFAKLEGKATPPKSGKPARGKWPWMEKFLEKAQVKLEKKNLKVTCRIFEGEPREALIQEAKASKAHSIFMGSRGLSGMKRLLLGSVSAAVALHAPCSVEIIRKTARRSRE